MFGFYDVGLELYVVFIVAVILDCQILCIATSNVVEWLFLNSSTLKLLIKP